MELIGCLLDGLAVVVRVHFNQLAHFVETRPEGHAQLVQSEFNVGDGVSRWGADFTMTCGLTEGKRCGDESDLLVVVA